MIKKALLLAGVFVAGVISGLALNGLPMDSNIPTGFVVQEKTNDVLHKLNPLNTDQSVEQNSPSNHLSEDQIEVYNDRVIIHFDKPIYWAAFTNTNSMDPVFDEDANTVNIIPESEAQIKIGDIISYKSEFADGRIIHRVIYKGQDEQGTYFVAKGDNNPTSDPGKIRFSQIKGVVAAIMY